MADLAGMLMDGRFSPLAIYGSNHRDPRLDMDAADSDTRNVLNVMANSRAEKDREVPDALARLLTTAVTPFGAAAARGARPIPAPQAENPVDKVLRWIGAARLHQRGEEKSGNPTGFMEGLGVFGGSTAAATAAALTGHPDLAALAASAAIMTRPTRGGTFMGEHMKDTRNIADKLWEMQQREAAKQPPPNNNGFTLY